jgi:hypothetical protein
VRGRQQTEEGNDKVNGGPIQNFTDSDVKWGMTCKFSVCVHANNNKTDGCKRTDMRQPPGISKLWTKGVPWLAGSGARCLLHISWSSLTVSRSGRVLSGQYGDDSGASTSRPPSSCESESGAEWFARGKLPYPATYAFNDALNGRDWKNRSGFSMDWYPVCLTVYSTNIINLYTSPNVIMPIK